LQNGEKKKKNKSKTFVNNFVFERNRYTSHPPLEKKYIKTGWRWSSKFTPVLNTSATRAHKTRETTNSPNRNKKNKTCSKVSEATKMAKILHKKFSQILLDSVMRAW
jgi:hypothetical protein